MDIKLVKNIDKIKLPKNIDTLVENLETETTHFIVSQFKNICGQRILITNFFDKQTKNLIGRTFFWKQPRLGFINEDVINNKWFTKRLYDEKNYKISKYFRLENLECLTSKDKGRLESFNKNLKYFFNNSYNNLENMIMNFQNIALEDERILKLSKSHPIPKKLINWVEKECAKDFRFIVYNKDTSLGFCSHCHEEVSLSKDVMRHNDKLKCPACGNLVTLKSNKMFKLFEREFGVQLIEKDSNNNIFVRFFKVYKGVSKDCDVPLEIHEFQRYQFNSKTGKLINKHLTSYNNKWFVGEHNKGYIGKYLNYFNGYVYFDNLDKVFNNTVFEVVKLKDYLDIHFNKDYIFNASYLLSSCMLEKNVYLLQKGLYNLAFSQSLSKEDVEFIFKHRDMLSLFQEINPSCDEFRIMKVLIENNFKVSKELVLKLSKTGLYYTDLKHVITEYGIRKLNKMADFLLRQNINDSKILWLDYLKCIDFIGADLKDSRNVFPSGDLRIIHDEKIEEYNCVYKWKSSSIIETQFAENNNYYFYKDKNFLIRLPKNLEELKAEGKKLSHCVGTYAESVVNNTTTILFVRKVKSPSEPFVTVELKDGEIRQAKGYKNSNVNKKTQSFIDKWFNFIKNKESKIAV